MSAGIKLMEERTGTKVTLYNLGHHFGGKASSYRDDAGFNIDHGFHAMSTNYKRFLGLLERAGVNISRALVLDQGTYFYDEDTGTIRKPGGITDYLSNHYARKTTYFMLRNLKAIYWDDDIEQYDDICWTAWVVERGLDEELTKKRSFRFAKDALFNWPYEISTYINFKSIRLLGGSSHYYLVNGAIGENIINPLVNYFKRLGGKIELFHKLTEVVHDGQRVTGLRFAQPDFRFHNHGEKKWERTVRVLPEITDVSDFDHVIIAIPVDNLRELNEGDRAFWSGFPGIEHLQSVATLSFQVWTEEPVLPPLPCCINLLDEPMPMVIDYKYVIDRYKYDKNYGSVLEWVGQENTFEKLTDEELKTRTYESFLNIPEAKDPRKAGIIHESLRRNTSNHERYLLTEPGTVKFRPHSKTHFSNMFLAGDWIRNDVEVPTMEGAICSGFTAVSELLKVF